MKKSLFLAALAAMSLASCSSDDVIEVKQDAITFEVVSDNASRALNIYSASNLPEKFKVYAVHTDASSNKNMYIQGASVVLDGGSYKFEDGIDRVWPKAGSLTFYAIVQPETDNNVVPCDITFDAALSTAKIYQDVPGYVQNPLQSAKHHDMIYAVKIDQTKASNGGIVALNFRHAFAQVVFKAKNLSPKTLHVVVDNVWMKNVNWDGLYTLPTTSTDNNVTTTNGETLANQGTWSAFAGGLGNAETNNGFWINTVGALGVEVNSTSAVDITSAGNEFLMLPTTYSAYNETTNPEGALFEIRCKAYNIADASGNYDAIRDVLNYENVEIPMDINWEQGKKYTYTLIFGDDTPISFELTVDDYIIGSEDNVIVDNFVN